MFEEYISVKLSSLLSFLCENISQEELRFSILSGELNLESAVHFVYFTYLDNKKIFIR